VDVNWQQVWGVLGLAGAWLGKQIPAVAAEAVAYAQKYYDDRHLTNRELEEIAVDVARRRLPLVPAFIIRWAIRRVCKWRKRTATAKGVAR